MVKVTVRQCFLRNANKENRDDTVSHEHCYQSLCALASRYSNVTFIIRICFTVRGKPVHDISRPSMPARYLTQSATRSRCSGSNKVFPVLN
jgi:hypothetical protein